MAGERTLPGLGLRGFYTPGTAGYGTPLSEDLRLLSAVSQLAVSSRTTAISALADGTILIARTDDATNPNKVAIRDNGAWVYYTPHEGMMAYVRDEDIYVRWTGSEWVQSGQFYDVNFFIALKPGNNELLGKVLAVRPFTFDTLTDFQSHAGVAATAQSDFTLAKNGTTFATLRFAASGTTASVVSPSNVQFALGDRLTLHGPTTADATLSDITFSLKGRLL